MSFFGYFFGFSTDFFLDFSDSSNIEEQVQMMSLGEESLMDDSIIDEYMKKSIDPRIFRNTLTIEEYPSLHPQLHNRFKEPEPVYATVNLKSKHETREEKKKFQETSKSSFGEYEDIEDPEKPKDTAKEAENIYELVTLKLLKNSQENCFN